jgi:hypothetical protein
MHTTYLVYGNSLIMYFNDLNGICRSYRYERHKRYMAVPYSCTLTHNYGSEIKKILDYTIVAIFWLYYRSVTVIYTEQKKDGICTSIYVYLFLSGFPRVGMQNLYLSSTCL